MVSDFVECARAEKPNWKTSCAWAAATIAGPAVIKVAAKAVLATRIAMRTGVGLREAYAGLQAARLEPAAMAALDRDVARVVAAECAVRVVTRGASVPNGVSRAAVPPPPISRMAVGECRVTGIPHGVLGEAASLARLRSEGYVNIVEQVRFKNSRGNVFIADFVAKDSAGNWVAIEAKTGRGATMTENQAIGYPELERVGAVLDTSKLSRQGIEQGDVVKMRVDIDAWECPSCS